VTFRAKALELTEGERQVFLVGSMLEALPVQRRRKEEVAA
jgi:hypothetical protein